MISTVHVTWKLHYFTGWFRCVDFRFKFEKVLAYYLRPASEHDS